MKIRLFSSLFFKDQGIKKQLDFFILKIGLIGIDFMIELDYISTLEKNDRWTK